MKLSLKVTGPKKVLSRQLFTKCVGVRLVNPLRMLLDELKLSGLKEFKISLQLCGL